MPLPWYEYSYTLTPKRVMQLADEVGVEMSYAEAEQWLDRHGRNFYQPGLAALEESVRVHLHTAAGCPV